VLGGLLFELLQVRLQRMVVSLLNLRQTCWDDVNKFAYNCSAYGIEERLYVGLAMLAGCSGGWPGGCCAPSRP
jgi:hypothetical protein